MTNFEKFREAVFGEEIPYSVSSGQPMNFFQSELVNFADALHYYLCSGDDDCSWEEEEYESMFYPYVLEDHLKWLKIASKLSAKGVTIDFLSDKEAVDAIVTYLESRGL